MCDQNFQLVPVPRDQYGSFYDGDSYLILAVSSATHDSIVSDSCYVLICCCVCIKDANTLLL